LEFVHAVALTSEPEDRLVRKLSKALCAVVTLPEFSADPISESRVEKEDVLELLEVLPELFEVLSVEVLSVEVLSVEVLSDEVLLVEFSRLVSEL
jgi:hypothetical protein